MGRLRNSGKEQGGKSGHIVHVPEVHGLHVSSSIKNFTFELGITLLRTCLKIKKHTLRGCLWELHG